ncbi:ion channel [Alkalicoccus daliensis]|uniref:Potassium channel LctB n=1 Tax=Alkalicoccus daliensis TaxID=745820 RepID=A0A1H0J3T8_9BACI|nr:ion channel [Alkalicoccus daliensis]SDO38262.1 potassium channel LctB [Alkalicoccus daliensis]
MVTSILVGITIVFLIGSLVYFFLDKRFMESKVHVGLLLKMFFTLLALTFGFTFLYYFLSTQEVILHINDPSDSVVDPTFMDLLYFSGVTLLSVGYGDYVPVGSARFFALVQAALGLIVPSAYFLTILGQKAQERTK